MYKGGLACASRSLKVAKAACCVSVRHPRWPASGSGVGVLWRARLNALIVVVETNNVRNGGRSVPVVIGGNVHGLEPAVMSSASSPVHLFGRWHRVLVLGGALYVAAIVLLAIPLLRIRSGETCQRLVDLLCAPGAGNGCS